MMLFSRCSVAVAICIVSMPCKVCSHGGIVLMQLSSRWQRTQIPAANGQNYSQIRQASSGAEFLVHNESERKATVLPSDGEKELLVNKHNLYRCKHDAGALVWSDELAEECSEWVKDLKEIKQSDSYNLPTGPAAENMAWSSGSLNALDAVTMWYKESDDCIGGPKHFEDGCRDGVDGAETRHFTAMVWKGAVKFGCAYSASTPDPTVVICRYKADDDVVGADTHDHEGKAWTDTPNTDGDTGNYILQVLPLSKTDEECESTLDVTAGYGSHAIARDPNDTDEQYSDKLDDAAR